MDTDMCFTHTHINTKVVNMVKLSSPVFKFNGWSKPLFSHLFSFSIFLSFHLFTLLHPSASGRYKACGGSRNHPVTTPVAFWVVEKAKAGQLACQNKKRKNLSHSFLPSKSLFTLLFNCVNLFLSPSSLTLATSHRTAPGIHTWKSQRAKTKRGKFLRMCASVCVRARTHIIEEINVE